MSDAIAKAAADLTADENAQPERERVRRRRALTEPVGALEEDHQIRDPREPVERSEEARDDRSDRGRVAEDQPVHRPDPIGVDVRARRPEEDGQPEAGDDRDHTDEPHRDAPAGGFGDDAGLAIGVICAAWRVRGKWTR